MIYIRTSLEFALSNEKEDFLKTLLENNIKTSFLKSTIPLWEFTDQGADVLLERLLNLIPKVKLNQAIANSIGTPLYVACSNKKIDRAKRIKIVKLLLEKDDDPNYIKNDKSLLMKAVSQGDYELCQILLKAGAKTYVPNAHYQPIHIAIIKAEEKIALLLLDNGANSNAHTIFKSSNLSLAIRIFGNDPNSPLINRLLEDVNVNIKNSNLRGASPLSDSIFRDVELFKKIHLHDSSVYSINEEKNIKIPIVHIATSAGRNKHLKFLIDKGYNPFEINKKDVFFEAIPMKSLNLRQVDLKYLKYDKFYINKNERAIDIAIRNNDLLAFSIIMEVYKEKELEKLLESFIKNNYMFGNKTLIINIQKGYIGTVKIILKHPVFKDVLSSINYVDGDGKTALDYASKLNDLELQKLLKENNALISKDLKEKLRIEEKENSFISQISKGNIDKFSELLEKNIDNLFIADENNTTPLMACAKYNQDVMLEVVLKNLYKIKKLNSNINRVDVHNKTALSYAIDNRNIKILTLLLENSANPNFRYAKQHNYLIDLAFDHSEESDKIITLLFNYKVSLNIKDLKFLIKNKSEVNTCLLKLFENEIKEFEIVNSFSKKSIKNTNTKQILIANNCVKTINNIYSTNLRKLKETLEKVKNGENQLDTRDLKGYSTKFSEIKINNDRIFYIRKGEYFVIIDIYINKHQDSLPSKYYNYVHNKAKEYKFMIDNSIDILKLNTTNFYEIDKN